MIFPAPMDDSDEVMPHHGAYNIVVVGDGYAEDEQQSFESAAMNVVVGLIERAPFNGPLGERINVWSVPSVSAESGIQDDEEDIDRITPFGLRRTRSVWMQWDSIIVQQCIAELIPDYDAILLVGNTDAHCGTARHAEKIAALGQGSNSWSARETAIHELGHLFGLKDEYILPTPAWNDLRAHREVHRREMARVRRRDARPNGFYTYQYTGAQASFAPWFESHGAREEGFPIVSRELLGCLKQDTRSLSDLKDRAGNPIERPDVIGAFEGALYLRCQAWRPSPHCLMGGRQYNRDDDGQPIFFTRPFCAVCHDHIAEQLQRYASPPAN